MRLNPLRNVWNVISTVCGVVGLVSFSEDVIAWRSFFSEIMLVYRGIVSYPFIALNLELSPQLIDYAFIGSLCGAAYSKAIRYGVEQGHLTRNLVKGVQVFYFVLYLLFWPFGILITAKQVLIGTKDYSEKHIKIRFLNWLGTIVLGFLCILILNTILF